MNNYKNNWDDEQNENVEYGEFVPSYFCWNSLEEQKKKVKRLENITNEKEDNIKSKTKKKEER